MLAKNIWLEKSLNLMVSIWSATELCFFILIYTYFPINWITFQQKIPSDLLYWCFTRLAFLIPTFLVLTNKFCTVEVWKPFLRFLDYRSTRCNLICLVDCLWLIIKQSFVKLIQIWIFTWNNSLILYYLMGNKILDEWLPKFPVT